MSINRANPLQPALSRDERSRRDFVSSLRTHVLTRLAGNLRKRYDDDVGPALEREHGRPAADGVEVHRAIKPTREFRFYSSIRSSAQQMVFASVIPAVERSMDTLAERARAYREDHSDTVGTLTLDPGFEVPRNVADIDVHYSPGSYHGEYTDDDVAAGAVYDAAIDVFAFGQFGEEHNDIGMTMANYVRHKYPQFEPRHILDCGCTVGHNTLPWAQTFPQAEVHAIDVAPGVLRYASARAQAKGVPVRFKQMDATRLDYPDASFDVVFSSMFLHELPLKDIRAYFREAYRVLKPGGLLWTMELPPNSAMGAYESFYLDWDSYYNNEPFYKTFRDQDYRQLCIDGGFDPDEFVEVTLPRYTFIGDEAFRQAIDAPAQFDGQTGRMDPKGTRWYGFGAWKRK